MSLSYSDKRTILMLYIRVPLHSMTLTSIFIAICNINEVQELGFALAALSCI
jgi:hypothetical protein